MMPMGSSLTRKLILFGFLLPLASLSLSFDAAGVAAEIPADVRDVFESMLDNLEPDLQAPFRLALDKNTSVVEMTPAQFRKFRDNPFNPFEGLDEIDASDEAGDIALKFELPSLRTRPKAKYEKQNRSLLKHLKPIARQVSKSVVRLYAGDRHVAMGTIVSADDGLLITKTSEVTGRGPITCLLSDGRKVPTKLRRANKVHDVALMEINATGLRTIQWTDQPLSLG